MADVGVMLKRVLATVSAWWHTFLMQREVGALEARRDEYLCRLGRKTYASMKAKGPDVFPEAEEAFMDVRSVQHRIDQLQRSMAALRAAAARKPSGPAVELPAIEDLRAAIGQVGKSCACGALLAADAAACPECGLPVEIAAASVPPAAPAAPAQAKAATGKEPRRTCARCGGFVPLMTDYCPTCQAPAISYRLDED